MTLETLKAGLKGCEAASLVNQILASLVEPKCELMEDTLSLLPLACIGCRFLSCMIIAFQSRGQVAQVSQSA